MINSIKRYKTENATNEVWKNLKYLSHTPLIEKSIKNSNPKASSANIRKQAQQISYCIRQSEEYFIAAKNVSLTTKPLLLYYGVVSLANALILLKKDGTHSIDYLRRKKKHRHHGLELKGDLTSISKLDSLSEILSEIECSCFFKVEKLDKTKRIPWGQFSLFYDCLKPSVYRFESKVSRNNQRGAVIKSQIQDCTDMPKLEELNGIKFNTYELILNLPDLYHELFSLGLSPNLGHGEFKHEQIGTYDKTTNDLISIKDKYDFFINGLSPEKKETIQANFKKNMPNVNLMSEFRNNLHYQFEDTYSEHSSMKYLPDIVDNIHGELFYIVDLESYMPESVSMYIILFNLGMLSRYYPDVWMKLIDDNPMLSEFINYLMQLIERKLPNLILDQLTGVKHQFNGA